MSNNNYDDFPNTNLDELEKNGNLTVDELLFEKVKHYSMCLFGLATDLQQAFAKYLDSAKVVNEWKARSDFYYKKWKRECLAKKNWYNKYKELKALMDDEPK